MPIWDPLVPVERAIQRSLARLPPGISHWLGYRAKPQPTPPTWLVCVWGFIGAFCGLSCILAIFGHTEYFTRRAVPPIIASFGASAILCYNAIDAPLAQPRSLIFGHFFSGLTGRQYPKFWVAQVPPPPRKTEPVEKVEVKKEQEDSDVGSPHNTLRDVERGPA
ncbi:HPP family protein [Pyrenophora tritici-repentis]|nr:HPP family protein [Pyrenophora tritici-repentis]